MPEKRDYYSSYGQKLISLFAKLLFTQRSHSLIELSRMLHCSKQTVLRLVDDIRRSYGVEIEEAMENRKKYYRNEAPRSRAARYQRGLKSYFVLEGDTLFPLPN